MSRMRVMGCTGSLQNSDSMKCCSRRCLKTRTVGAASPACSGPNPNLCSTGGRTCTRQRHQRICDFTMILSTIIWIRSRQHCGGMPVPMLPLKSMGPPTCRIPTAACQKGSLASFDSLRSS